MQKQRPKNWDDVPLALTPQDLWTMFDFGRNHAYEIAAMLGVRVGRKLLIPREKLRRWLEEGL